MISGKDIRKMFKKCSLMYSNYSYDSTIQELILKLALLDLCGWIERAFDQVYIISGKSIDEQKIIKNKIDNCYSFKYERFKEMMCFCVGVHNFNSIKNKFKPQDFQVFCSTLSDLSNKRDMLAHNNHDNTSSPQYIGLKDLKMHFAILLKAINLILVEIEKL